MHWLLVALSSRTPCRREGISLFRRIEPTHKGFALHAIIVDGLRFINLDALGYSTQHLFMPTVERTKAGLQFVLPGAERRTAPRSVYSAEPTGQLLVPGVEPVTDRDRLALLAAMPLRPRKGQRPLPATGLFGRPGS